MKHLVLLFKRDVEQLEYDPGTQYRFHFVAAWFWFATMIAVPFVPVLRHPILSLLIMEASLWANFATHFGAMSAALAAKASTAPPSRAELAEKIEELRDPVAPPLASQQQVVDDIANGLLE